MFWILQLLLLASLKSFSDCLQKRIQVHLIAVHTHSMQCCTLGFSQRCSFILPTHAVTGLLLPPAGSGLHWRAEQAGCFLPCSRWEIPKHSHNKVPSHWIKITIIWASTRLICIFFLLLGSTSCWDLVWRFKQPWCSVMDAISFLTCCTSPCARQWGLQWWTAECKGEQNHSASLSSRPYPPAGAGIAVCINTNLNHLATSIEMLSPFLLPPYPRSARLSVALCAGEHDPLGVPAASLRPQRWQLTNGWWLHQQPARQVDGVPQTPHSQPTSNEVERGTGMISGSECRLYVEER